MPNLATRSIRKPATRKWKWKCEMRTRMRMEMPSGAKLAPNSDKLDPSLVARAYNNISTMHTISMLLALKYASPVKQRRGSSIYVFSKTRRKLQHQSPRELSNDCNEINCYDFRLSQSRLFPCNSNNSYKCSHTTTSKAATIVIGPPSASGNYSCYHYYY